MNFTPAMNDGRHVFVFGSNLAGRHGAGAALEAKLHWGARTGVGEGPTGLAYAIPTKCERLVTLPVAIIGEYVAEFKRYAAGHGDLTFLVTRVGCGLAGYHNALIAPLFAAAPANCVLPREWLAAAR